MALRAQLLSSLLGVLALVVAMIVTLFAIGAGTIFPIVIVFGSGLVVFAVGAGGTCGAAVRARRTQAG